MKEIYLTKNNNPIKISHFPGYDRYLYKNLMARFERNKVSIPDNITLITVADDDTVAYDRAMLIRQLNKSKINFVNPAKHVDVYPWVNNRKIELIINALKRITTEYCLILDSLDVTINSDLSNIIELFQTYNKEILFNATNFKYPNVDVDIIENREELYGRYCYLNAGCCIGLTSSLLKFYEDTLENLNNCSKDDPYWESEQYHIRKTFSQNMETVGIDYECKIFQVWHKLKLENPKVDIFKKTITYKIK